MLDVNKYLNTNNCLLSVSVSSKKHPGLQLHPFINEHSTFDVHLDGENARGDQPRLGFEALVKLLVSNDQIARVRCKPDEPKDDRGSGRKIKDLNWEALRQRLKSDGYFDSSQASDSQAANDINLPAQPERVLQQVSRIIRDTAISRELKLIYDHCCQLCGTAISLCGRAYSEAHHIKPLGSPHNGDDTRENLICVCPNCHVLLDYAAIPLDPNSLKTLKHVLDPANVAYHNALYSDALSKSKLHTPVRSTDASLKDIPTYP